MTVPMHSHLLILPMQYGVASHPGRERPQNEDAFGLEHEAGLFVVSDGMGGHRGGELASRIVIQDLLPRLEVSLTRLRRGHPRTIRRLLKRHIAQQSREVHLEGGSESGYKDMGATVVLALLHRNRAYIGNLGDSRAYRLRGPCLRQMSHDHSLVAELVQQGELTPTEADAHDQSNIITRYIGMEERAEPHICSFTLKPGDRILLCTDGLTDMVEESTIRKLLLSEDNCQACCDRLIKAANDNGGHDNITVLLITWNG